MAILVLTGAQVLMGTAWTGTAPGTGAVASGTITSPTDISQWVQAVEWPEQADTKDATSMASGGFVQLAVGLKSVPGVKLTLLQDYGAAALDAVIYTTLGGLGAPATSPVYVDIKPTTSARSTTNPSRVGQILLVQFSPFAGKVGDLQGPQVSWPLTGWFGRLVA